MTILITGGLGYIGSHVAALFAQQQSQSQQQSEIVLLDNLCNSNISVLTALRILSPNDATIFHFYEGDVRDRALLDRIFQAHTIDTVIHMAALKSVAESIENPEEYESVNVGGTRTVLEAMEAAGCRNIVFSSSATVYGQAAPPLTEDTEAGVGIASPYGQTKWSVEQILRTRTATATTTLRAVILRYFNPIGAHPSRLLGEAPTGTPNNLLPVLLRQLNANQPLTVFGDDWPTRDGTCVRDYVDIQDLAAAHVAAVARIDALTVAENPYIANVGTGRGTSVLELLACFEAATGCRVPYTVGPRRPGDLAEVVAAIDPDRMAALGWSSVHTLEKSCRNAWNFSQHCKNFAA